MSWLLVFFVHNTAALRFDFTLAVSWPQMGKRDRGQARAARKPQADDSNVPADAGSVNDAARRLEDIDPEDEVRRRVELVIRSDRGRGNHDRLV